MALTASINAKVDMEDKKSFEDFCRDMGMNTSVAINMFIKYVNREQRMPFTLERDPFYSAENMARLNKSIQEIRAGKGMVHELIEVDDE